MNRIVQLVLAAAFVMGLAAESLSFGWQDPAGWLPDLIVGWSCVGCGIYTWSRRPDSRTGLLTAAAGIAWFIGNFSHAPLAPVAWVAGQLVFLHRAVLMHAVLTLPTGRIGSRIQMIAVVGGYIAWLTPLTASVPVAVVATGVLFVGVAAADLVAAARPARRMRTIALFAAAASSLAYILAAVAHAAIPSGAADAATLLGDEAAILVAAVATLIGVLLPRMQVGRVTDLVVELSESRSGVLEDELGRALGDPSLRIGYWHPASNAYLDASGQVLPLPTPAERRALTPVEVDGRPAAVLVHAPAILESEELSDSVRTMARLAAANVQLRADLLDQLAEVRASRRRLLTAEDAERSRLGRRVDDVAAQRARALGRVLSQAATNAATHGDDAGAQRLKHAGLVLQGATLDLEGLAQGLHPRRLTGAGLSAALRKMAAESPISTEVVAAVEDLPEPVELALYFVGAEGLSNVIKHSRASRASVSVRRRDGDVVMEIADDGIGGADLTAGSGLQGIADRVEAVGGSLEVRSSEGAGTQLTAAIPLGGASA